LERETEGQERTVVEQRTLELSLVHNISDIAPKEDSLRACAREVLERATLSIGAPLATLYLSDGAEQDSWRAVDSIGQVLQRGDGCPEYVLGQALSSRDDLVVIRDASLLHALFPRGVVHSAIVIVLRRLSRGRGALAVGWTDTDSPTSFQLRLYRTLARRAGLTLDNLMLRQEMERAAATDFLTRLANRRQLYVDLAGRIQRSASQGRRFAVLLLDLKGFKRINDDFGHARGDAILQTFGRVLVEHVPTEGEVYRYGGDEFIVLADDPSDETISLYLQEVTRRAEGMTRSGEEPIRFDAGWSRFPDDGTTVDELLEVADSRMYDVKRRER